MGTTNIGQSSKTLDRINEIYAEIKSYKESIKLLNAYAEGKKTLKVGRSRRVYKRTRQDDERCQWTLRHFKEQMLLLDRELSVLLEYGV